MANLRILIADDHEIVRRGLRSLLTSHPGWEVCAEAENGLEAVKKAAELKPDIIALDIGMPQLNGLDAARQILRDQPKMKILFLTVYDTDHATKAAVQLGAKGLILKSDAARELVVAVEAIQGNSTYFTGHVKQMVMQQDLRGSRRPLYRDTLTPREREITQLLAEGKTTKSVAAQLNLSVKTVETHRSNIMSKLGLHSVTELVLYAVRNNIVQALSDVSTHTEPPPAPKSQPTVETPDNSEIDDSKANSDLPL